MPAFLSDSIVRGLSGDFQKTPLSQTSAVGASCPFPRVVANVLSPNPQQPFAAGNTIGGPRTAFVDLLPSKPPEGKLDGGEGD
jgi:hypothetical protein